MLSSSAPANNERHPPSERDHQLDFLTRQLHLPGIEEATRALSASTRSLFSTMEQEYRKHTAKDGNRPNLEGLYSAIVPQKHRKALGQFFTPPDIASFMVQWALTPNTRSFLDPAVGTGIFIVELAKRLAQQPHGDAPKITAYEIDPLIAGVLTSLQEVPKSLPVDLRLEDFLLAFPSQTFDGVVCNPPYIRHHALDYPDSLFKWFDHRFNLRLSRLANIYILFMFKIVSVLSEHGRAAIITPGEYLNANFGEPFKKFLLHQNLLDSLIIFDHGGMVFENTITTGCITLIRRDRTQDEPVRFVHLDSPSLIDRLGLSADSSTKPPAKKAVCIQMFDASVLDPADKWVPLAMGEMPDSSRRSSRVIPLSEMAEVNRGIATGANKFFTLSPHEVDELEIEKRYLKPCLTKAQHAPYFDFGQEDFERLAAESKRVYLLDCQGELSQAVQAYLRQGERQGIHKRYLTSHRTPWYATEKREVAPILVTVFARRGFRFVLNRAGVWNLTAFHCIYPRFDDREQLRALMSYFTSTASRKYLQQQMRTYGVGLMKFEPGDVGDILVPNIESLEPKLVKRLADLFDRLCVVRRDHSDWANSEVAKEIAGIWSKHL